MKGKFLNFLSRPNSIIILFVLFFGFVFSGCQMSETPAVQEQRFIVGCYYNAAVKEPRPEDIKYDLYTHVFYAFLIPDKAGNLSVNKVDYNILKFVSYAHKNQVKALLSLGGYGGGDSFPAIMAKDDTLKNFMQNITTALLLYDFDGIDVDWESSQTQTESDGQSLSLLLKTLREKLNELEKIKSRKYLLTAAFGGADWNCRYISKEAIMENLDFINVMAYDIYGCYNGSPAANHAPLFSSSNYQVSCKNMLEYWSVTKEIPKDKIVMGIPFYGRGYTGYKPFETIKTATSDKLWVKTWGQISNLVSHEKWTREFDEESQSVLYFSPDKNMFVGCDDPQTVNIKTKWAKTNGYHGAFSWSMHADSTGKGEHPLAEAIKESGRE